MRTSVSGTYARTGLPAATTANAVYDIANQLTSWNGAAVTADANGNLTSQGGYTYTYNARNQLTTVMQGAATRGAYVVDGLGRRVRRTVGSTVTRPVYDDWNVVQERAQNGNTIRANLLVRANRHSAAGVSVRRLGLDHRPCRCHRCGADLLHLRAVRPNDRLRGLEHERLPVHWPRQRLHRRSVPLQPAEPLLLAHPWKVPYPGSDRLRGRGGEPVCVCAESADDCNRPYRAVVPDPQLKRWVPRWKHRARRCGCGAICQEPSFHSGRTTSGQTLTEVTAA